MISVLKENLGLMKLGLLKSELSYENSGSF